MAGQIFQFLTVVLSLYIEKKIEFGDGCFLSTGLCPVVEKFFSIDFLFKIFYLFVYFRFGSCFSLNIVVDYSLNMLKSDLVAENRRCQALSSD